MAFDAALFATVVPFIGRLTTATRDVTTAAAAVGASRAPAAASAAASVAAPTDVRAGVVRPVAATPPLFSPQLSR